MSITSSVIAQQITQTDGSRKVIELHTGSDGKIYERHYSAGSGADVNALLSTHATELLATLAEAEAEALVST